MTSDRSTLRIIEEWTGHRQPPRAPMKAFAITLLWIGLIGWALLAFCGCATVETRTTVTAPDGTITVTESKTTAPDAGSLSALSTTAQAFAPRAVIVHPAK